MLRRLYALLISDSFVDYLEGVGLFAEAVASGELTAAELDAELMERLAAVTAVERWVELEDYVDKIGYMIGQLSQHGDLLMRDDADGHAMQGIVLFINGIAQGQHNVEGFKAAEGPSGWALAERGGQRLAAYFDGQSRLMDSLFFKDLGEWFGAVHAAQAGFLQALAQVRPWSEDMALGLYAVLPMASLHFQGKLLAALKAVGDDPAIRVHIMDRYLDDLQAQQATATTDAERAAVAQRIDMVLDHRAG